VVLTIELCCVQEEMGWRSCLPTPWGGGGGSRGHFPLIVSLSSVVLTMNCAVYRRRWGGGAVYPLPGEEEEGAEDGQQDDPLQLRPQYCPPQVTLALLKVPSGQIGSA
jgi:hypothetical protein